MENVFLNEYLSSFGSDIRRIRRYQGISLEGLAERAGVHPNTIAVAERAERDLNIISQTRIFAALGCKEVRICEGYLDLSFSEECSTRGDLLGLDVSFIIRCIGENVRMKRIELGLTLEELSSITGIHLNSLWNCENGLVVPKGHTLVRLYQALGINCVKAESRGLNLK